jgi:hypothetical protein
MKMLTSEVRDALNCLQWGEEFPYDASDKFREDALPGTSYPPPAEDWAHMAARGIVADLQDRRVIKQGFANIDEATRIDIIAALRRIILLAHTPALGGE